MPRASASGELPDPEPRDEDAPVARDETDAPSRALVRFAALLEQEEMAGVFPGEPLS
jgi:hypothetical protein